MATIDLTIKNGEYSYHGLRMVVKTETCQEFKIFERRRYKAKDENKFFYLRIKIDDKNVINKHFSGRGSDSDYVNYIDVYFSRLDNNNPLIFEFRQGKLSNYFKYRELSVRKEGVYTLGQQHSNGFQLWDNLVRENDIINQKISFRIEKKDSYNNVKVDKVEKSEDYVIFQHRPKDNKVDKSCVIWKNILFRVRETKDINEDEDYESEIVYIKDVQHLQFDCINTYYLKNYQNDSVPLLVEFIESKVKKYYFSRKNHNESYWTQENIQDGNPSKNSLDNIDFLLNNSVSVFLHNKLTYDYNQNNHITQENNLISDYNTSSSIIYEKKVKVSPDNKDINDLGYECYKHYLCPYTGDIKHNIAKFIIIKIFIFNKEIDFYNEKGELEYLIHSQINHQFEVYFYKNDNFPLLVKFGDKWYCTESKQDYLFRWKEIKFEHNVNFKDYKHRQQFIDKLNDIICMLNQINLRSIDDYGFEDELDEFSSKKTEQLDGNNENFDFIRVNIVSELYDIFTKFTHTPKNKFKFNKSYLIKESLEKENNQTFLSVEAKSVSIYFFHKDAQVNREYPLILEYYLDSQKYEYYVLEPDGLTFGKYNNKSRNGKQIIKKELDILLDHQNFIFNNVGCIRLDRKCYYTCCESQLSEDYIHYRRTCSYSVCFIKSDKNKKFCDISRLVIDVKKSEELKDFPCFYSSYNHSLVDCLKYQNHKDFRSTGLQPNKKYLTINKMKIFHKNINLIYRNGNVLRHFPISSCSIYFCDKDPRPILLFFNNLFFAPKTITDYYKQWVHLYDIQLSKPRNSQNSILLQSKLNEVCYYLNPVDVSNTASYTLDKYFRTPIIYVKNEKKHSFSMLTYTSSSGCRLGITRYKTYNVFENYDKCIYKSSNLIKVVAYYLIGDFEYKYPLLIEFEIETNGLESQKSNELYQLISISPYQWEKVGFEYTKEMKKDESISSLIFYIYNQLFNHEVGLMVNNDFIKNLNKSDLDFSINNNYIDPLFHQTSVPFINLNPVDIIDDIRFDEIPEIYQHNISNSNFNPHFYDLSDNSYYENIPKIDLKRVKTIDLYTDLETGERSKRSKRDTESIESEIQILSSTGSGDNFNNSNSSNLPAALGGTFGFLLCVGLASYPAYMYLKKFKIKDMRPFFN